MTYCKITSIKWNFILVLPSTSVLPISVCPFFPSDKEVLGDQSEFLVNDDIQM